MLVILPREPEIFADALLVWVKAEMCVPAMQGRTFKNFIITGTPGIGKTLWQYYALYKLAAEWATLWSWTFMGIHSVSALAGESQC